MSTTATDFINACFDELQISRRYVPYVRQAEQAGYPQLAKLFRALVASETTREAMLRRGMVTHAAQSGDFYVCPHCGLIYDGQCPDECLVDQTPGADFIVIH